MTTDTDTARDQARAQLDTIITMMDRLDHANECGDPDDCKLRASDIGDGLDYFGVEYEWDISLGDRGEYHDTDKAQEAIHENALSVEVRSAWEFIGATLDPAEYSILLCTGGPAVRIVGDLGQYGEPDSARLQYQDWGTPWTEYITIGTDHTALLAYAGTFYWGG